MDALVLCWGRILWNRVSAKQWVFMLVALLIALQSFLIPLPVIADSPVEDISLRTENSKTVDLGNGHLQTTFSMGAIHYKDDYTNPSEQWKDIDLTWVDNRITKAPYELTLEDQKLTIRDKKTGDVTTIELLSVKPAGIPFKIIPEYTRVSFRHTLTSDKLPFEARFKVTGKGYLVTRAFDDDGGLELETSIVDGILTEKLSRVKDKGTGRVRPAKGNIRVDPTWQVTASTDDCNRRLDLSLFSLVSYIPAGSNGPFNLKWGSGMRFLNITIPKGSTIDSAKLAFQANLTEIGTVARTRISAEDVDDAITFANDAGAFDTRWAARTTARMDWDGIPVWTQNVDYESPTTDGVTTFASIIQEVIDRAGWALGNDIVIFWEDFDDRSDGSAIRIADSWDNDAANAPELVITFTTPVPVQPGRSAAFGLLSNILTLIIALGLFILVLRLSGNPLAALIGAIIAIIAIAIVLGTLEAFS